MDDLISRQAAIDATWEEPSYTDPINVLTEVRDRIKKLPSAQPERKKGKWIPLFDGRFTGGAYWFHCSKCERVVPDVRNGGWNFCPNCGANMREDQDG